MPRLSPWACFFNIPTVADSTVAAPRVVGATAIKVIMCSGQVKSFHHPFPASDLMSEFPSHLVCHSDSFLIGQKVPALESGDVLRPGNSYFLLPAKFFNSALSLVSIASSFSPADRAVLLKMVEVQKTPSGKLRIRVSDEFMERADRDACGLRGRVCSTAELEREYKGMVKKKGDCWKPKLETIKEKDGRKKEKKEKKRDDKSGRSQDKKNLSIPPPPPPPPPPPEKATSKKEKDKEKPLKETKSKKKEEKEKKEKEKPPKESKSKKKNKNKEKTEEAAEKQNTKPSDKSEDKENVDTSNLPSSPPPPPPPPPTPPSKASKKEKKSKKDKEKIKSQQIEASSHESHTPPPPPLSSSPPSPSKEKKEEAKRR